MRASVANVVCADKPTRLPSSQNRLDDTTRRCVATFHGNDGAKQAETRCNGPFEAERQLDAMAANALHVRSGSRQPIVRCVNRVARNTTISTDIACEGAPVPGKQLLDEMADEMRAHPSGKQPAALQWELDESPDATAEGARGPQ
jgi:hypothetical protein